MTATRATAADVPNRIFYLTAPPEVQGVGSWCATVGAVRTRPGAHYPPEDLRHPTRYRSVDRGRVLDEVQLVLIADGRGTFEDERRTPVAVSASTCLLLLPGRWHRYAPDPDVGWLEYWVGVRGPAPAATVRLLGLESRGPLFRLAAGGGSIGLFEELLRLASAHDTVSLLEMGAVVTRLLAAVARSGGAEERAPGHADAIDVAIRTMRELVPSRGDIAAIAARSGLSEPTFRRVFRERTGSSPYRFYMALKINAVKRELARSDRSLREIADDFAFTDQYHLSRVFKEYAGEAPSVWRRHG